MDQHNFSIKDAKQLDMVEYLQRLGHAPSRIRNTEYWYRSPFRDERTASFKVNKNLNYWFDFGAGEGGNIIDFGIKYFNCSVKDFLLRLKESNHQPDSFLHSYHRFQPQLKAHENEQGKIIMLAIRPVQSKDLTGYIKSRNVDLELAKKYCKGVDFTLYNRTHTALGFKNDNGGFELRNSYFKGSSSPKFPTLINSNTPSQDLLVFEGFFNFLSYLTAQEFNHKSEPVLPESQPAYLVLNSLGFFEMSSSLMEKHEVVKLYSIHTF